MQKYIFIWNYHLPSDFATLRRNGDESLGKKWRRHPSRTLTSCFAPPPLHLQGISPFRCFRRKEESIGISTRLIEIIHFLFDNISMRDCVSNKKNVPLHIHLFIKMIKIKHYEKVVIEFGLFFCYRKRHSSK